MVELYWNLKDETKNADFQSLSKKIKRSPYNALLMRKFNLIMELNDRRFCQLTFVLKRTVGDDTMRTVGSFTSLASYLDCS